MAESQPADDSVIDGYQLVQVIAVGGTSQVREVREQATNRILAMKLLNSNHPEYKEHISALKREAQVLKSFEHPNIVRYEGFTASRDHTYLLMEYFRAPNLKVLLKTDRLSLQIRFRKIMEGICAALQHVHDKGWVHRDVKPDNVLMNKVGEVKLIDFSLASRPQSTLQKLLGKKETTIQGTRTYLAPETIRKQLPTCQTDLYSLGVLIFEVLTGKTPFQGTTPDDLLQKHLTAEPPPPSFYNANLTPEIDRLVLKLLSKKPDKRGKDVAEIAGELRRITIFKEEPQEGGAQQQGDENTEDLMKQLQNSKLDSRLDAKRSELIRNNPELARQLAEQQRALKEAEEAKRRRRVALVQQQERQKAALSGGPGTSPGATPAPPVVPVTAAPIPAAVPVIYPTPGPLPGVMPTVLPPGAPHVIGPTGPVPPIMQPVAGGPYVVPNTPSVPASPPGYIPPGAAVPPGVAIPTYPPGGAPLGPIPGPMAAQPPGAPPQTSPQFQGPHPTVVPSSGRDAIQPPISESSSPHNPDDDLEYMTELPDVI